MVESSVLFLSQAGLSNGIPGKIGLTRPCLPIENVRGGISKKSMILNDATPKMEIDTETYEVRADGEVLTCEPAKVLPMAQRYFLF